jgi:hypothetical protein
MHGAYKPAASEPVVDRKFVHIMGCDGACIANSGAYTMDSETPPP